MVSVLILVSGLESPDRMGPMGLIRNLQQRVAVAGFIEAAPAREVLAAQFAPDAFAQAGLRFEVEPAAMLAHRPFLAAQFPAELVAPRRGTVHAHGAIGQLETFAALVYANWFPDRRQGVVKPA